VRIALLGSVLVLAACGGAHRAAPSPRCTLTEGQAPSPETGEHSVVVKASCALTATPQVQLFGQHGSRLDFTYVQEGGARGGHTVLLDKYRCDIRYRDLTRTVELAGGRLDVGRSLLDWCPDEGVSTVVHVYLGGRQARPTWRGVLHDVYDGRLDRVWPCAALRTAIAHLPVDPPMFSKIPGQLARAAAPACAAQLAGIATGAPRFAVEEALGPVDAGGLHCPVWRWDPEGGAVDGARVCFANGRATLVQTALHG
jgi:hypothetical protein